MMKAEERGNGVIVPDKLWQFLTNLAAMLPGGKSDAKIAEEKQIQRLAGAILDYGRMGSQLYSHQGVGVGERELAFRFRETTGVIVTALVLLEKEGRARRTRLAGYWTLRVWPRIPRRCSPAMKSNEEPEHEEQLPHSNNPRRKKPYEAPKLRF